VIVEKSLFRNRKDKGVHKIQPAQAFQTISALPHYKVSE
jgi:hypothetical protein